MKFEEWKGTIVSWVNVLSFTDISDVNELKNGEFFLKVLDLLEYGEGDGSLTEPLKYLFSFIKEKFPKYELPKDISDDGTEITLLASLLLLWCCLQVRSSLFLTPLYSLNSSVQSSIQAFLQNLLSVPPKIITKDHILSTISSLDTPPLGPSNKTQVEFSSSPVLPHMRKGPYQSPSLTKHSLAELRSLQNQFDILNCEYSSLQGDLEASRNEIKKIRTEVEEKDRKILKLENELFFVSSKDYKEKNKSGGSASKEKKRLKIEISQLEEFNVSLRQELNEVTEINTDLRKKINSLEKESINWKSKYNEIEEKCCILETQNFQNESLIRQLQQNCQELKELCYNSEGGGHEKEDYHNDSSLNISQIGDISKTEETMASVIEIQYKELQLQFEAQENDLLNTKQVLQDKDQRIYNLMAVVNKNSIEMNRMEDELNKFQAVINSKEEEINELQKSLCSLSCEAEQNKLDREYLMKTQICTISKLECDILDLHSEVNTLSNMIFHSDCTVKVKDELIKSLSIKISDCEINIISRIEEFEKILEENKQLLSSVELLKEQLKCFQCNLEYVQSLNENLAIENETQKVKISHLETEIEDETKKMNILNNLYTETCSSLEHKANMVAQLEEKLNKTAFQMNELSKELDNKKIELSEMESEKVSLNEKIEYLELVISSLEKEKKITEDSLMNVSELNRQNEIHLQEKENIIGELNQSISSMKTEFDLCSGKLLDFEKDIGILKTEINLKNDIINSMNSIIAEHKDSIMSLEEEKNNFMLLLKESQNQFNLLENNKVELLNQIEILKKELTEVQNNSVHDMAEVKQELIKSNELLSVEREARVCLQSENLSQAEKIDSLSKEISSLNNNHSSKVNNLESEVCSLNEVVSTLKAKNISLNEKIDILSNNISFLKEENNKNSQEYLEKLNTCQLEIESLNDLLLTRKTESEKIESEFELSCQDNKMLKELINSESKKFTSQINELQGEIVNLIESLKKAEKENVSLLEEIKQISENNNLISVETTSKINELTFECNRLKDDISSLENTNKNISHELSIVKESCSKLEAEKTDLFSENLKLEKEMKNLNFKLNESGGIVTALKDKINKLDDEVILKDKSITELKHELSVGQKILVASLNQTIEDLKQVIEDLEKKLSSSEKEKNSLRDNLKKLNFKMSKIEEKCNDQTVVNNNMSSELNASFDRLKIFKKENAELSAKVNKLCEEINNFKSQAFDFEEKNKKLSSSFEEVSNHLRDHKSELDLLRGQLFDSQTKIIENEGFIKALTNEKETLLQKLEKEKQHILEKDVLIRDLNNDLDQIKKCNETLCEQHEKEKLKVSKTESENKELKKENDSYTKSLSEITEELNIKENELETLLSDYKDLNHQLEIKEKEINDLKILNKNLNDAENNYLDMLKHVNEELTKSHQQQSDSVKENESLKISVNKLSAQLNCFEKRSAEEVEQVKLLKEPMQEKIASLECLIDQQKSEIDKLQEDNDCLCKNNKGNCLELGKQISVLTETSTALKHENISLRNALANKESLLAKFESEKINMADSFEEQIFILEEDKISLTKSVKELELNLQKKTASLETVISNKKLEIEKLMNEKNKVKSELENISYQLDNLNSEISVLNEKQNLLKQENASLKNDLVNKNNVIARLECEKVNLFDDLENLNQTISEITVELQSRMLHIEQLEAKLSALDVDLINRNMEVNKLKEEKCNLENTLFDQKNSLKSVLEELEATKSQRNKSNDGVVQMSGKLKEERLLLSSVQCENVDYISENISLKNYICQNVEQLCNLERIRCQKNDEIMKHKSEIAYLIKDIKKKDGYIEHLKHNLDKLSNQYSENFNILKQILLNLYSNFGETLPLAHGDAIITIDFTDSFEVNENGAHPPKKLCSPGKISEEMNNKNKQFHIIDALRTNFDSICAAVKEKDILCNDLNVKVNELVSELRKVNKEIDLYKSDVLKLKQLLEEEKMSFKSIIQEKESKINFLQERVSILEESESKEMLELKVQLNELTSVVLAKDLKFKEINLENEMLKSDLSLKESNYSEKLTLLGKEIKEKDSMLLKLEQDIKMLEHEKTVLDRRVSILTKDVEDVCILRKELAVMRDQLMQLDEKKETDSTIVESEDQNDEPKITESNSTSLLNEFDLDRRLSCTRSLQGNEKPKKEKGQISYHKPGPPTPSKNAGRLSLPDGNELPLSSGALEEISANVNREKQPQHGKIRSLFTAKPKPIVESHLKKKPGFFKRKFGRENDSPKP